MASPRGGGGETRIPHSPTFTPGKSADLDDSVVATPALLRPDSPSLVAASGARSADSDIRAMLQALPTRADLESLLLRLEEAHRQDIQLVRGEVQDLAVAVAAGETALTALEQRVSGLERSQADRVSTEVALTLHLEDLEDRSRRQNVRIKGIPEATGTEDLAATVSEVFRLLWDSPPQVLEMDRVHRSLGPKSPDPNRPRDVICRLHRFSHKEGLIRRAWEHGTLEFDGANLKILPDLSRATLHRRALLRPLLDLARRGGFTYRWGYPFAVTFRNSSSSFTLRTLEDLTNCFDFLGTEAIPVPNWLLPLPRMGGRLSPAQAGYRLRAPPRRPAPRSGSAPVEVSREI